MSLETITSPTAHIDAVMSFVGVPVGPRATSIDEISPGFARVAFAWDAGGSGTMHIQFAGEKVSELNVSFDV
jgi:hypothetical protein